MSAVPHPMKRFACRALSVQGAATAGALLLVAAACGPCASQSVTLFYVEPATAVVPLGATVSLELWLDAGENIADASSYRGVQAHLAWDPGVVSATSVMHHHTLWYPGLCADPGYAVRAEKINPDWLLAAQLSLFSDPQCPIHRHPVKLFTIAFETVAPGTSAVSFEQYTRLILSTVPEVVLDHDYRGLGGVIQVVIPFVWGDLNGDGLAGTVDASLLLRWDAFLIDVFPGYPELVRPAFPTAADTNADGEPGAVDAANVLRLDALLLDCFPADSDCDGLGPDR